MKKIYMIVIALILASPLFVMSGCMKDSKPSDIEMSIWNEFKKNNFEKGVTIWFDNLAQDDDKQADEKEKKETISMFTQKVKESLEEKQGIKDVELVTEEIAEDGLTAKVTVKLTYGNGETEEETSSYKKVDEAWKIVFIK